jgi:hypothetical protein
MNIENTNKLWETFPHLYVDRHLSKRESLIPYGFECGDGWFDLIWNLSEKLEQVIVAYIASHPGKEHPRASQVKSKYGGLRFYMTRETPEMDLFIRPAEESSYKVCEDCGKPGSQYGKFWIYTKCESHAFDRFGEPLPRYPMVHSK